MSWQHPTLGDLIELENGYAFKSDEYADGGHFLMRIANVQQGYISKQAPKYVSIPQKSNLKQFELSEGDMLMSLTGNVGRVGLIETHHLPAALNQRVAKIKIKDSSILDKGYLFSFLNTDDARVKIENLANGAAQLNVSTKDIKSLSIPLPPLAEQRRIAAVLDKAEEIKRKREAAITKLDQLAQSVFVEMFGDPISNDKSWKQSAVGKLPIFIADGNYSSKYPTASEFVESGVPFIRANNLKKLTVMSKDLRFISKEKHSELAKGHLQYRDVLIITRGEIGKVGLVPKIFEDANINAQLVLMRCINDEISPDYLCHLFNNKKFLKYVENFQTGAALKQLPVGNLKKIKIPIPTKEMQARFAKFISHLELNIARMDRCESTTINLTSSLQHQAFTTGFET